MPDYPNLEEIASLICDAVAEADGLHVGDEPMEDMRSGGYFFDVETVDGRRFTVLVSREGA